jgi:hypothetical protein
MRRNVVFQPDEFADRAFANENVGVQAEFSGRNARLQAGIFSNIVCILVFFEQFPCGIGSFRQMQKGDASTFCV